MFKPEEFESKILPSCSNVSIFEHKMFELILVIIDYD